MTALSDLLREEHALIRRAAACLDRLSDDALEERRLDVDAALLLLEFFEDFADGIHQTKEERLLFPELVRAGLAPMRVERLKDDHRAGREQLGEMRRLLEAAAFGNPWSREGFALAASSYSAAELEHAEEEDHFLLPLVEELLDEDEQGRLVETFRDLDETLLPRTAEEYAGLVDEASRRLGSIA